jgi:hypothetical protein
VTTGAIVSVHNALAMSIGAELRAVLKLRLSF